MSALFAVALALPVLSGCEEEQEYTCVCFNTLTGNVIERAPVRGSDAIDAAEECDDRESLTIPDRCVLEENCSSGAGGGPALAVAATDRGRPGEAVHRVRAP